MKALLKKIIPIETRIFIRKVKKSINNQVLSMMSSSYLLSSLYYLLFNRNFRVEQKAVLTGRVVFDKRSKLPLDSSPQLRRNIHRLEKGLIMRPRRPVFAEAYIIETIDLYSTVLTTGRICDEELKWATDVLSLYFLNVEGSETIDLARKKYKEVQVKNKINDNIKFVPFARADSVFSELNYDEFTKLCLQRRSVRWYEPELVPDNLINKALEAARTAPSACNRQPFEFLVLNDNQKAPTVAAMPAGTAGFSNQVPCIIVVIGDLSCYPKEADRHVIYIDSALASMQFMLALETLGLSSCPINWPENETKEKELHKIIPLPVHKRVIMMISVGYAKPTGMIPYSSKKPLTLLRTSLEKYKS
ncbi:nitroreductase family protein [Colwellia sp. C1TZA3]|uniref:nitroreductase family protein n=1 Tax=Colwellia sp. C1TZA3 TaxID=2508879 RepID=UPI0011BA230E|nr:nitroreductase family protein [Colwellia sp. C1TZA3]TWX67500.1 nitroreductase family protein [Colwellia sp. C1TZA3]